MKPILYKANEATFETYGLGEIDATKALVTRERNGNYTLYIEYPASGRLASVFKNDMRIKSDAGLRTKNQTFYISRIVKSSKGVIKIYAKHISHLTGLMAIRNKTIVNGTASNALSIWSSNTLGGIRFDTWSDITTSNQTSWDIANVKNAREALGGREGSILDVWGGEFEFDNTTIRLHKQLGRKSPIVLEYGRNILSAEDEQDIEATYTSIYPYATYTPESTGSTDGHTEAITVELPEKYIDSKYVGLYNERRVGIVDFSSSFKEKEVPTAAKLKALTNAYINNNNVGLPKINTKIEYVDLSKAQDHALNQILEEAELCDIVPIYYPPIGITSEDGKLTTIVFDVLRGVNDSVEVGTIGEGIRSAMTSGLATQVSDIAKSQKQLVDNLPKYLLNAQGNKVWYNRPPENAENKVGDIWFEKNGLYDRMYIWNGAMWEKRIDTEDVDNIKKEVEKKLAESKQATDDAMDRTRAIADLALQRSGSDSIELASKKIIKQVLDGKLFDSSFKKAVNKTFEEDDNGSTIYGKISSEIEKKFITIDATDSRFRQVSEQVDSKVSGVNDKLTQTNRTLTSTISDVNQAKTDISNTRLRINDANQKIDKADKKINDVDGRVDQATRKLESANVRIDKTNIALEETNGRIDQTNRDLANTNAQVEANKRQIEVQVTNFNAVRESTKLFERILGTTEEGAPDKLSRLVMSSEIFQTEVGKYVTDDNNLIVNSMTMETNTRVNDNKNGVEVTLNNGVFSIKARGLTRYNWTGFTLPIYVKKIYRGETYTLGFKYRIREKVDTNFVFVVKNHKLNKGLLSADIANANTPASGNWIEFQRTFTVQEDFAFGEEANYPFYIYISKNGWVEFKEPILVRGSDTGPYKPSQFDDAYKQTNEAKQLAEDAQTKAIQVAEQARQAQATAEATRTQVTQLAGSWAVRNLTNSGDVLNSINLLANGTNRIDGRLTHITGQTVIDNAVIKDGMIEKVSANKLTAGTIDAREINLINVNARSVTSGTFTGLTYEGGIIRGNNGNTIINLNDNVTTYNGTAKIEFKSPHNTLEFNSNGRKAFLAPTISLGSNYPAFAFGINDRGEANSNNNFVGLKIFNQPGYRKIVLIGDVHIVKNSVNENAPYVSLADLFNRINDNFKKLHAFRVQYNEGSPGFFDVSL